MKKTYLWLAVLLASLAVISALPARTLAHGGGTPQLTDVPAGPYRVFVWTSPDPWQSGAAAHFTVAVTQVDAAGATLPVSDAQVALVLTHADALATTLQLAATSNATGAGFYEADGVLPAPGRWQVEVMIHGAAGAGVASFGQSAQAGGSINGFVWGGALLILLVLGGWLTMRQRTRTRTTPRPGATLPAAQE